VTSEQTQLWEKICSFELDDPAAAFTFTDRLARENGWPFDYALRAVREYKKFIFLLCVADHPLTPSDQIDQVWHLHLLYTQSYWIDLCQQILERPIHHGPTRGGTAERDKFTDWYLRTKEFYYQVFAELPPADLWPDSKTRFREVNFRRINTDSHWIIPKPRLFKS